MEPAHGIPALQIASSAIGVIQAGPTKCWLHAKAKWDAKYAKEKSRVQLARRQESARAQKDGFLGRYLVGERPSPSALAGRLLSRLRSMKLQGGRGRISLGCYGGSWQGKKIKRRRGLRGIKRVLCFEDRKNPALVNGRLGIWQEY